MNLAPTLISKLERGDSAHKLLLAAFLIYWICLLPTLFGHGSASTAASRMLTLPALAAMYWIASANAAQLARAFAVLGQMQAPHALMRALVREKLTNLLLAWAFLATGLTLQLALPASQVSACSGAALVSIAACLGTLRSLSQARLLALPLPKLLAAAPYLACLALILLDQNALLDRVGRMPLPILALGALTFPYLAWRLAQRWQHALPVYRWSAPKPQHSIIAWIAMQARRNTLLTWGSPWRQPDDASPISARTGQYAIVIYPLFIMAGRPMWAEGRVAFFAPLVLLFVSLVTASGLVARDVHWRSFLIPGGLQRGRIASHILVSTLAVQYSFALAIAAVYGVFMNFLYGMTWETIGPQLLHAATLPLELLFAGCLALVLRTMPVNLWIGAPVGVLMLSFVFFALAKHSWSLQSYVTISLPVFVLTMLVASAALLVLANRRWTNNRLFQAARRAA